MTYDTKPREFWIQVEAFTNRALVRDGSEKWPDDVNGQPSHRWTKCIYADAFEAMKKERDELKAYILRHETTSCDKFLIEERDALKAELADRKLHVTPEGLKPLWSNYDVLKYEKEKLRAQLIQAITLAEAIEKFENKIKEIESSSK